MARNVISLPRAREFCTAAEIKLVESATPAALNVATEAQIRQRIGRVRALRDKWRDTYERQTRQTQQRQKARASDDNDRSRRKSALFGVVLSRLEARLEKIAGKSAGPTSPRSLRTRPSPRGRAEEVRLTRSHVKDQMKEQVAEWESEGGTPAPDPKSGRAKPAASKQKTASAPAAGARKKAALPAVKKAAPATTRKAMPVLSDKDDSATTKAVMAAAKKYGPGLLDPPGKDSSDRPTPAARLLKLEERTAVKSGRIRASGLDTRTRGHVSARGKRAQARRDSKN